MEAEGPLDAFLQLRDVEGVEIASRRQKLEVRDEGIEGIDPYDALVYEVVEPATCLVKKNRGQSSDKGGVSKDKTQVPLLGLECP